MVAPRHLLRDSALLLLVALALSLLSLWLHPKSLQLSWTRPKVEEIELTSIKQWTAPVLWIDARGKETFDQGHIPKAILLNEADWEQLLPGFLVAWQPGTRVVIYCDTQKCDAGRSVALRLEHELNITDVFVLKGGWNSWTMAHR